MSSNNGRDRRNGRLRILQVGKFYPPYMGGIETHLELLSSGLRKYADVRVLVSNDEEGHVVHRRNGIGVVRVGRAMTLAGAPISPAMVNQIRQFDADIVHLHVPNPAAVLAYMLSGVRAKLVVTYHSDVVRQRFLELAFRPILFAALKRASAIISTTPNLIDSSRVLSRYRDRCHVVPFGIPIGEVGRGQEKAADLRKVYGNRVLLTVGRLVYYKGLDTLIDAMKSIDAHLLIVGEGPLRQDLERQARRIGVADRVTFLGGVDDVDPYYQLADLFVLASNTRSEAFGIVQIEAMAHGKPVVNTQLDSGVPYVSRHGETGITVPPNEPKALASAINVLLDDAVARQTYGEAARRRVESEFSLDRMVAKTIEVYERVSGVGAEGSRSRRRPLERIRTGT